MLVEIERLEDISVLRLKGRFATGSDRDYLADKAGQVRSLNCTKVLAEFRDVPYIDSTGIGFVVGLFTSVTKAGEGRFVLVGPHPRVQHVLKITRLDTVIPVAADMEAGIAYLNAGSPQAAGGTA
jgi:anti-anti-sigma factor